MVTEKHIRWADVICAMENKHRVRLRARFPDAMRHRELVVLDIPDDYRFMDPELVALLQPHVDRLFESE